MFEQCWLSFKGNSFIWNKYLLHNYISLLYYHATAVVNIYNSASLQLSWLEHWPPCVMQNVTGSIWELNLINCSSPIDGNMIHFLIILNPKVYNKCSDSQNWDPVEAVTPIQSSLLHCIKGLKFFIFLYRNFNHGWKIFKVLH